MKYKITFFRIIILLIAILQISVRIKIEQTLDIGMFIVLFLILYYFKKEDDNENE